jgi:hypothetical protein
MGRLTNATRLLLVITSAALTIAPGGRAQQLGQPHATLGSDVTFTVVAARSWTSPDAKFLLRDKVPDDSYYYLQMDGLSTGGGPSVVLENEGAEDDRTALKTGAIFKRRCVKLSPPKGKYLEVLLMFQNASKQTDDEPISGQRKGELDIPLTPTGGPPIRPLDFLATGFSTSRLSQLQDLQKQGLTVITEFTGTMSIHLEADGKTWILLLFDVPRSSKSAKLQIRNSAPITLDF